MLLAWTSLWVENQSVSIVCFESLIQVWSCEPRFYLQWKFLGLTWKWVRSVQEMSTLFSLYTSISILGTHLADNLLISKILVKTGLTETEVITMDLAICSTARRLSYKTIQWMATTCSSVVEIFEQPDQESTSVLSLSWSNSATNFFILV